MEMCQDAFTQISSGAALGSFYGIRGSEASHLEWISAIGLMMLLHTLNTRFGKRGSCEPC
jgi:hypothetical protein